MGLFGNKGPTVGEGDDNPAEQEVEEVGKKDEGKKFGGSVDIELAKIKGQIESLVEMRKATTERFGVVTEQMGEIRGMLTNLNQQFSKVEVGATKAIDKVDSVQPETFMTELRKNEGKIDALKANIESNESLMRDLMKEIKEMRHKMDLYKGTEQILKMHEEIKEELAGVKKVEGTVERHANRVETMFLDVEKSFSKFDEFNNTVKDVSRNFAKIQVDFDKVRVKTDAKAEKKEFVGLVNKFNDFEKHTGNIIKLLDERSKHVKDDIKISFENMGEKLEQKYGVKVAFKESKETDSDKKVKKGFFGMFRKKKKDGAESGEEASEESTEEPTEESTEEKAPELPKQEEDGESPEGEESSEPEDKSQPTDEEQSTEQTETSVSEVQTESEQTVEQVEPEQPQEQTPIEEPAQEQAPVENQEATFEQMAEPTPDQPSAESVQEQPQELVPEQQPSPEQAPVEGEQQKPEGEQQLSPQQ